MQRRILGRACRAACLAAWLGAAVSASPTGLEYVLEVASTSDTAATGRTPLRDQAMGWVEARFQEVCSVQVHPLDEARIRVRLYNLAGADPGELRGLLEKEGRLEFRAVHPESDRHVAAGLLPPGYELMGRQRSMDGDITIIERFVVKQQPERGLAGGHLKRAFVAQDAITLQPRIEFELDGEGARLFEEVTRELSPDGDTFRQLAIVLDGLLYSAPRIMEPIGGGRGVITGSFTMEEATSLARVLSTPFLNGTITVISETPLDPAVEKELTREARQAAVVKLILALCVFLLAFLVLAVVLMLVRRRARKGVEAASRPPPMP